MQSSVSSVGASHPGGATPGAFGKTSGQSRLGATNPSRKTRKPIRRPYKPLPTTRYLIAGLTAILLSMGLITGAMSSVARFDTKPWSPEQELHWDPFQKNDIPGFDPGALSQSGRRTSEAIPHKQGSASEGEKGVETEPKETSSSAPPTAETQTPAQESSSPGATFEVPGATQTPTDSKPPAEGKPPLASGKSPTVGSAVPKA